MGTALHKDLAASENHEPKGASTAPADTVYVADGSGSGSWQAIGGSGNNGKSITAYDSAGSQTFTGPVVANLDATLINDDIYTLASDEIEVLDDGTYLIAMDVTHGQTTSSRTEGGAVLQRDTGSGFIDVAGTQVRNYSRTSAQDSTTGSATITLAVSNGDKFRIQVTRVSGGGALTLIQDGTRLTLTKLR